MTIVSVRSKPLSVLVIGCGNIAGGYDRGRAAGYLPLTHAGAYARDGRMKISACVDPDARQRSTFMADWDVPQGFESTAALCATGQRFDVISICSPTPCHAADLETAITLQPKLIFCEKPLTASVEESQRLVAACRDRRIALMVNYTRRWDPDVIRLQEDINRGRFGALRNVMGIYNKGILNNGSHMLDLLTLLLGPLRIVSTGRPVQDYFTDDLSIPVWLEDRHGTPIQLGCAHAADYALFELQLVFAKGVIVMEEGGMAWRERQVIDSDTFKGYRKLDEGKRRGGEYPQAMLRAVDNIYRTISLDEALACDGDMALATQQLCAHIRQRAGSTDSPQDMQTRNGS